MVNSGEVRSAKLAKSTLLTSTLGPLGIFSYLLKSVQMIKREWSTESNGRYRTYSSLVKLQPGSWVYAARPGVGQKCSLGAWFCSERPVLWQNTLMMIWHARKWPSYDSYILLHRSLIKINSTIWCSPPVHVQAVPLFWSPKYLDYYWFKKI